MPTEQTKTIDSFIASRRALLMGGGAALAAMALPSSAKAALNPSSFNDFDILNFALNLEYLEANFYYQAAFGCTIDKPNAAAMAAQTAAGQTAGPIGIGSGTTTTGTTATVGSAGTTPVPFTLPAVKAYAIETAIEEGKHVLFLRSAIQQLGGTNVAQPAIDISPEGAFKTLGTAAGVSGTPFITGGQFNPYANDVAFLAGAYVFEDVGVTAYSGAAPLISTSTNGKIILQAAASILAVEAYHAGVIRTSIYLNDATGALGYLAATQKVSQLRTTLSQAVAAKTGLSPTAGNPDDFGIYPGTYPQPGTTNPPATGNVSLAGTSAPASNIADADPTNVVAFSRTTAQVLNIVTGGGAATSASGTKATGVFFPSGLNGTFA